MPPRSYPDDLRSPPRSATRPPRAHRTPSTPRHLPRRHHATRKRPSTPTETAFTDASDSEGDRSYDGRHPDEGECSPAPARTPTRFQRLSRMMMAHPWHPWQQQHQGHAGPLGPPPVPPMPPAFASALRPTAARSEPKPLLQRSPIRKAQHAVIWVKALCMLTSGASGVCFLGAFTLDQMLQLSFPGFTNSGVHTNATRVILAFGDAATFPPGSPLAGWSANGLLDFVLHYASLLAAVSCGVSVVFVAQGKRVVASLPDGMRFALSGWADRPSPDANMRVPPYGTTGVKLWIYLVFLIIPTTAFAFLMSALSSTSSYLSSLSDIGTSTSTAMDIGGILTVAGFIGSIISWLLHMQEQRLRVQVCRLEDRHLHSEREPASATALLAASSPYPPTPGGKGLPHEFYRASSQEDVELSPTDYGEDDDDLKTEVSTLPPPKRSRSQRKAKPRTPLPPRPTARQRSEEELTEAWDVEEESLPPKTSRKVQEKATGKKSRYEQQAKEPETPSSVRAAKEVYAEWGDPLQYS